MHTTPPTPAGSPASHVTGSTQDDRLSARSITVLAVAAATLSTVVGGVIPAGIAATGTIVFPAAFVAIAVLYGLFAVGFLAAARRFPTIDAAGAFYTLLRHSLGRIIGVGAAWVVIIAYAALTVGLYGLVGSMTSALSAEMFRETVPWQAGALIAVAIVAAVGLVGVEIGTRVLKVLIVLEIAMIAVVTAANLTHPSPGGYTVEPFAVTTVAPGAVSAVLALGVLGYIGTELTVVYSHSSRSGARGVARATYATIAILTVVYVTASYAMIVTLGRDTLLARAAADPGAVFAGTAAANLGPIAALGVRALVATSVLAGAVSFHWATSRYALFLGRDRALPAFLGRTGRRNGTPVAASLAQTAAAVAAIIAVTMAGADPVQTLFYVAGTAGSIGILLVLTLTALAIVLMFARRDTAHPPRRRWILSASIASAMLLVALVISVLDHLDVLLGVSPDSAFPVVIGGVYLALFALGALWAAAGPRTRSADTAGPSPLGDRGTPADTGDDR
ncbi:APC family permease [Amycolatopsis sp. H20-H5]|uniref:APC family permease n=1 Tax=Amycolatopsis sp. H20-H5 TaxID=3046309 RepID=UPI002DBEF182|nr:APC family permease [Amycolatopsis sp. H20-H5]MEC3977768.1 APC family permease [Amycolatopsis sp. H20-H5]